jgi:deoxyribonuclease-4
MLIGAHESVAGGLASAFARGKVDGCAALQIFTKNSNMWREPALDASAIASFRAAHAASGAIPVMAHTSYLINLATDKRDVLEASRDALVAEVNRSSALGVAFCVLHPGAHLGAGEDVGVARTVESLDEVHARTPDATARILIENTAGQGTCVGHRFEHLEEIFARVKDPARIGICLDTQHTFAAGYDLSTPRGYERTLEELDRAVGLARVEAIHLNDSKKPVGSRVDRHENIGEGLLGLSTFWRFANDARFASVPAVVETEGRGEEAPYREEVALLRSLIGAPEPHAAPFRLELDAPAPKKGRAK